MLTFVEAPEDVIAARIERRFDKPDMFAPLMKGQVRHSDATDEPAAWAWLGAEPRSVGPAVD